MICSRLRFASLGGYPGSGKTTWPRHRLHVGALGSRVHVVVNEAAEVPVGDVLLAGAEGVTLLSGCRCFGREAMFTALRRPCDLRSRLSADEARPGRIVLGTSGHATLSAAVLGEALALPPIGPEAAPAALPALCEDDLRGPIRPTQVAIPEGLDGSAFTRWLSALLPAQGDGRCDHRIVSIGRGYRPQDLARSMHHFLGLPPPPTAS